MNIIWDRLNEKYGDKIDLVDIVIKDLEKIQTMRNNDDQKFILLVDVLEKGVQGLEAIGQKHEIANAYTVKLIELKLNRQLYLEWLKEEENLEGSNRFEKLVCFLKNERRRIHQLIQRCMDTNCQEKIDRSLLNKNQSCSHGTGSELPAVQWKNQKDNCLIHPNVVHFTRRYRVFLTKSPEKRASIVKERNGCKLCLCMAHIGKPCPWEEKWGPCKYANCGKYHSHLLHEASTKGLLLHTDGREFVNEASVADLEEKNTPSSYRKFRPNMVLLLHFSIMGVVSR